MSDRVQSEEEILRERLASKEPHVRWAGPHEDDQRCTRCRHATIGLPPDEFRMYCDKHQRETGPIYTCSEFDRDEHVPSGRAA